MKNFYRIALVVLTAAMALPVLAADWRPVARTEDGVLWELRTGTVALQNLGRDLTIVGVMRRLTSDSERIVLVGVAAEYCSAPRGEVTLFALTGEKMTSAVFEEGASTVPALLSKVLCTEIKKPRT